MRNSDVQQKYYINFPKQQKVSELQCNIKEGLVFLYMVTFRENHLLGTKEQRKTWQFYT